MAPPHEGLDPDDRRRADVDTGLVAQLELVALDAPAQLAEQPEAVPAVLVALGHVDLDARPVGLGLVHGDVGVPE